MTKGDLIPDGSPPEPPQVANVCAFAHFIQSISTFTIARHCAYDAPEVIISDLDAYAQHPLGPNSFQLLQLVKEQGTDGLGKERLPALRLYAYSTS